MEPPMRGDTVQWYIAGFIVHRDSDIVNKVPSTARRYWCLLIAENSNMAHARAVDLASTMVGRVGTAEDRWIFDGIMQLLMLSEAPRDGGELIWTEAEFLPDELVGY